MEEHLKSKGIDVNTESLRSRIKQRKTIGELESNKDKQYKKTFDDESESDSDAMETDVRVGRKRKRSMSSEMSIDEGSKKEKVKRALTPAELKVRTQSKLRSMS